MRLRTGQIPPRATFMQLLQSTVQAKDRGNWAAVTCEARALQQTWADNPPRDTTGLPRWWSRFARTATRGDDDHEPVLSFEWDACTYIRRESGRTLGFEVSYALSGL